jgi:aspartokinase
MEKLPVTVIESIDSICQLRVTGLPDTPGLELAVMDRLRAAGVPFEVVSARLEPAGTVSLTLLLPTDRTDDAAAVVVTGGPGVCEERLLLSFVRVSGDDLADAPGAARRFIKMLAAEGIAVRVLSTTRTAIGGAIPAGEAARARSILAEGFEVRPS